MFGDPRSVGSFYFYSYEHLDDLSFLRDPADVFRDHDCEDQLVDWSDAISKALRDAGWEGDGDISIMWFPPFVGAGTEDTYGTYVWAVKQLNNGTTWIASPVELPFPRLAQQN